MKAQTLLVLFVLSSAVAESTHFQTTNDTNGRYYSESVAKELIFVASAAYSDTPQDCMPSSFQVIRQFDASLGYGPPVSAFVAVDHQSKRVILSCRVTNTNYQLLLQFLNGAGIDLPDHEGSNLKVVKYFADAYRALAKEIITAVKDAKKQYGFPVFATGHSLGGALATLLSFELAHEHGITPIVYTYGQPRVGNYEFAKKFDQLVPQMYRVVRNRDVVAHIPFCKAIYLPELANPNPERLSMVNKSATETFEEIDEIMRNHYELVAKSGHLRGSEDLDEFELRMKSCYEGKDGEFAPYHPTTEIWYRDTSGPMTDFVECKGYPIGEDNGCSNGQLNTSVGDHVTYFGIRVGSWCIDQLSTDIKMA